MAALEPTESVQVGIEAGCEARLKVGLKLTSASASQSKSCVAVSSASHKAAAAQQYPLGSKSFRVEPTICLTLPCSIPL